MVTAQGQWLTHLGSRVCHMGQALRMATQRHSLQANERAPWPSMKKGGAAILFLGSKGSGFTVSVWCELTCSSREGVCVLLSCGICCLSAEVDHRERE